jgi:hypothetical protein
MPSPRRSGRQPRPLALLAACALLLVGCDSGGPVSGDGRIYAGGVLFGRELALDGDVAIVSAVASNEAFLLRHDGRTWRTTSRLRPPRSRLAYPGFGWSVALSEGVAVVGMPELDVYADDAGAAFVYERAGERWARVAELRPADLSPDATFGLTVAVSSRHIAVGAPSDGIVRLNTENSTDWGTVHVFTRTEGSWTRTARLRNPSSRPSAGGLTGDPFGARVALDGNRLAVHAGSLAELGVQNSDLVRLYEFDGEGWPEVARLSVPDARPNDRLGAEGIAIDGPTLVASAVGRTREGVAGAGAVFVYREEGGAWALEAELMPDDLAYLDSFAQAVAVSGDRVAVGAPGRSMTRGSVFVYVREPSGSWRLEAELWPEGQGRGTRIGESVALEGDRLLAGAIGVSGERGAVYEFRREGSTWRQVTP